MADGLDIKVDFDIAPAARFLSRVVRDQIPFATALALTRTAQDVQSEVREDLPRRFIIRSRFVQGGIRITPSKKRGSPQFSEVGSRDEFMALQESGGIKRPQKARSVAVPQEIRRTPRTKITPKKFPRPLAAKPGRRRPFFVRFKSGTSALVQRKGKKPFPLKVLYIFKPKVRIPPRFGFRKTVERTVGRVWARNAERALEKAVASARPPRSRR